MRKWLIDTGPIVAFLDRSDGAHEKVVESLESFDGKLYTTSAVLTECMHFLGAENATVLVEFLYAAGTGIVDFSSYDELRASAKLMRKYEDLPMDYADSTLVLLGSRFAIDSICTLDVRGFRSFRMLNGKEFRLVME